MTFLSIKIQWLLLISKNFLFSKTGIKYPWTMRLSCKDLFSRIRNNDNSIFYFFADQFLSLEPNTIKFLKNNYMFKELFGYDWIKIWCKNIDGLIHGLRCPFFRMGYLEYFFPFIKIWDNFKCFWYHTTSVSCEYSPNFSIHSSHLRIV